MNNIAIINKGISMFCRSWLWKLTGHPRFKGNPEQICSQVIKKCWDPKRKYFRTSSGHFSEFWTRDFSWVAQSLINLGHREKVELTLKYALAKFRKHGHITTTISPSGTCFDVPEYGVDSLPSLIRSLKIANMTDLIRKHQHFLNREIMYYYKKCINPKTGLVRSRPFSEIKDHYKRNSSCYANCMAAMLALDLKSLDLRNPFHGTDYSELIIKNFWNGSFFFEDITKSRIIASDAQIFPFWTGVIADQGIQMDVCETMTAKKLDFPRPMKYTSRNYQSQKFYLSWFAPNYEGTTTWSHLGGLYLNTFYESNRPSVIKSLRSWSSIIARHRTMPEVINNNGSLYRSFFYHSDCGMLWAAMFLEMMRK